MSFAPVVMVAVIFVALGSAFAGVISALWVALEYVTVPGIDAPVAVTARPNVVALMLDESIGSPNVTVTVAEVDTVFTPFAGPFAMTIGGVVSRGPVLS